MQRGQITLLIIMGISLLLIAGLAMYWSFGIGYQDSASEPHEILPLKNSLEDCLKSKISEMADYATLKGGYYGIGENTLHYSWTPLNRSIPVPYYFIEGKVTMPSIERISEELAYGLDNHLNECTNLNVDGSARIGEVKRSQVHIHNHTIDLFLEMPVELEIGKTEHELDSFHVTVQHDLGYLHGVARDLTYLQEDYMDYVCMTCRKKILENASVETSLLEVRGNDSYALVYSLQKDRTIFNFAHKMAVKDESINEIMEIGDQSASVGYSYSYQVEHTGQPIFFDETDLFNITPQGLISFLPQREDIGMHVITIGANFSGTVRRETFKMEIDGGIGPHIPYIGYLYAEVGETFSYEVNSTGGENCTIIYADNTSLFDIDPFNGTIVFEPADTGTYPFQITVTDSDGYYNTQEGTLIVI